MKTRLFALAKELGLDSKELIQICNDVGVEVKNSLATLTDEQADQIRSHVKSQSKGSKLAGAEPPAPTRQSVVPERERRVRDLPTARRTPVPAVDQDEQQVTAEAE